MYSVNSKLDNKIGNFYFSTKINLSKINPYQATFQTLLTLLYENLEHNPPRTIQGKQCVFKVRQIVYWAKIGSYCFLNNIDIPSKGPIGFFPPLAEINGTYRVHFHATCSILDN
jgi:hypothetical protein